MPKSATAAKLIGPARLVDPRRIRLFHRPPQIKLAMVDRDKLRFFEYEPCFTVDRCSAVCKYARFGYSHSTLHDGAAIKAGLCSLGSFARYD